jgi:threonylcarbamoyladenosine tRNA methylthiotransferase MtaB
MPYLHLSLQAGDDMILKRMKRRHSRQQALDLVASVRAVRPDVAFGADLIAGFPTETDEMFGNTLRAVTECDLTFLHVFPYSPRPGTPAARMPQVNGDIRKDRARQLRQAGEAQVQKHLETLVGKTLPILMEKGNKGRTPYFSEVVLHPPEHADAWQVGSVVTARMISLGEGHLVARAVEF